MSHTIDSIWSDRVKIVQPAHGYRFALDAVLLAHWLECTSEDSVLEIGCGVGVIAILLAQLQNFRDILCVEVQSDLAELARKNMESNHLTNAEVRNLDVKELTGCSFDLVYANPPYRKLGQGRLNPSSQKAIARHELNLTLEELFICISRLLKPQGQFSVILPEFREKDFEKLVQKYQFSWRKRRYVHSFSNSPPQFFLATISFASGPFVEHPRLIVYDSPGTYTEETQLLLKS
ncbi:MAG: hypothetical protein C5B54_03255 [Acidobacteria bacterium]|nr:MAG: hypothetical protein C5B54_03255 [Acidobacteriota bacterium]